MRSGSRQTPQPALIRDKAFVGGQWIAGLAGKTFPVKDPGSDQLLGEVADLNGADFDAAIKIARAAQEKWAACTANDRAEALHRLYDLIIECQEDLALIVTLEMGKPLVEAREEVSYGASYVRWFAEEARRAYGDTIPPHRKDARLMVWKQPVGVVAAIAPWNFPFAMPCRKIAPALAAGCSILFKPAQETPLSALALADLANKAGIPSGVLNVITTSDDEGFGREVCSSDIVKKLTFTGSTDVGRYLMGQASDKLLRLSLELGGNAPFIVFEDADIEAAVVGCIQSKFRNNGQTCVCANRIYVHEDVHDEFVARLVDKVSELKVGHGLDPETKVGPLISEAACRKVARQVKDAVAGGAVLEHGNGQREGQGTYMRPVVLTGVTDKMLIAHEETFGPVAPIFRFADEEQVIALANDTEFGLATYFYANDLRRVWRVAERLEAGMVGVNTGALSTAVAPFGGVKHSGFGKEGSRYGLDDFTSMKYVCLGGMG